MTIPESEFFLNLLISHCRNKVSTEDEITTPVGLSLSVTFYVKQPSQMKGP